MVRKLSILKAYRGNPDDEITFCMVIRMPKERQTEIEAKLNQVFGPYGNEYVVFSKFSLKRFEVTEVERK